MKGTQTVAYAQGVRKLMSCVKDDVCLSSTDETFKRDTIEHPIIYVRNGKNG